MRWRTIGDDRPMFAFVRDPPATVGELAAALGLPMADLVAGGMWQMGSVAAGDLHATYAWDMYHEHPVASADALAARALSDWTVRFGRGREGCEAELRSAYGAPRAVAAYRRYGPFFVAASGGDAFALEWYAAEPDWAKPPVDPAAVETFAARVRRATTEAELGETALALDPPLPARDVARALGHPDAIGRSIDVHMSAWGLAGPAGEPLRVGRWDVQAALDGWASGPEVAGLALPAAAARHLGAGDVVHRIAVNQAGDSPRSA
jgi:hypothetical protein